MGIPWWSDPLLNSVLSTGEVMAVPVLRIFVVEELDDSLVGYVKSSGAAGTVFVLFDRFLCIVHFRVANPGVMFASPSFPFDEIVNDFVGFLSASPADRSGFRVEYFFDLELLLVVNELGRGRGRYLLVREGGRAYGSAVSR